MLQPLGKYMTNIHIYITYICLLIYIFYTKKENYLAKDK